MSRTAIRRPRLTVADPRCEGLTEAPVIDTVSPRFSWRLETSARDTRQTAWQLRVTEVDAAGRPVAKTMRSPRIASAETQWVVCPGFTAQARRT